MPAEFRTAVVDPDAVRQRRGGARGARAPRGAVPRQPRGAPALRRAQRLHRRGHARRAPDDDAILAAAVEGVRALNARYAAGRAGRVLPLPPAAALESAAGRVDGLGAQARQARRVQPLPARRRDGRVLARSSATSSALRDVRYVITLDADTVLPPDAAPLLVGALAHPLNRAVYDRRHRARRARLRHPAAARRRVAAERAPLALRRDPLRAPGRGSVHDGGVRRLPGPVRRGELHRQGDLRRRRVRAGDARPLPREHAALARPDRGQLRARRARHRHQRLRRLSDALPHATRAASTAGSAATGSCCRG